jgi:hypothetical protein
MTKITFDIEAHADHDEEADWYAEDLHSTQSEIPQDLAEKLRDNWTGAPLPPAPVQMPAPSSVPHVGPSGPRA